MNAREVAVDVLAATRLTRLVIEDSFPPVKALRDRIVDAHTESVPVFQDFAVAEDGSLRPVLDYSDEEQRIERRQIGSTEKPDSLAELITCPWCAGMWVSLGVIVARRLAPRAWDPLAKALATSMVVGLIESKVDVD